MNRPLYALMQRHGLKARDVALLLDYSDPRRVNEAISREKAGQVFSPRSLRRLERELSRLSKRELAKLAKR